jgi:hypothetical protein
MSPLARLAGVFVASLVVSLLVALLRRVIRGEPESEPSAAVETFRSERFAAEASWVRQLTGDLVRGGGAVLIGLLVIEIVLIGDKGRLEAGWAAHCCGRRGRGTVDCGLRLKHDGGFMVHVTSANCYGVDDHPLPGRAVG